MKTFKELYEACCAACEKRAEIEEVKEPTGDLKDACWKGYTAVGMKMKNGRKVPNCVPVKEDAEQIDEIRGIGSEESYDEKMHKQDASKMRNIASKLQAKLDAIQKPKSQAAHTKALKGMSKTPVAQFLKTRKGDGTVRTEEVELEESKEQILKRFIHVHHDASGNRTGIASTNLDKVKELVRRKGIKGGEIKSQKQDKDVTIYGKNGTPTRAVLKAGMEIELGDAEQIDEISTGKKMAVAYRAGKRYIAARNTDASLRRSGAHRLANADVTDKKKIINTIRRSGTLGKLASIAGAVKKTYGEEVELEEGYTLKKVSMDKHTVPGNSDDYSPDVKVKETSYHIVHNKTGKKVGTAHLSSDNYFGHGKLHVKMNDGTQRHLEMNGKDPQAAINKFIKHPKTSSKYKVQEEVEQIDEMDKTQSQQGGHGVTEPYDYDKGKWSKARIMTNKEVAKKVKFDVGKLLKIARDKKKIKEEVELDEGYMMAAAASANQPQYKERTPEEEKKHAERKAEKYLHMPGKNAAKKRKYWVKKVNKLHGIPEETKPGKNVVPPHVGALATGGIVKEEEGENKPLGKVMRAGDGKKKFKVYVKNAKGNVVKVGFGDPNMEIKRDDPERRKNFRARHNCDTANDRTTPRYWSCRQWRAGAKVEA